MLRMVTLLSLCFASSGCTAIPVAAAYSGSLTGVKRVSALYLIDTRPAVPVEPGVACITDNMKRLEIIRIGSKDSRFLTPVYRSELDKITARPEVAECLAGLEASAA